ncbi:MAG TPA: serine/threonine-protein kinase [Vicinamibacterales bacterium]|nr:serine/threonine-protein kinase [Vicinamibacterales bacterium]
MTDDDLTVAATPPPRAAGIAGSRFPPGAVVAGRYRLVAMLGRGGMGEVYRADDLTLLQPVALKFLPAGVAADAARLAQFHDELRTARQVSHKNVVRLYDLGEADGHRFLTMELVDGEDLASLLKRIGRFPQDRALAVARQLCAGVAAAHDRGVIHRDLKPANVMIDREGDVRITDFGIATAAADVGGPAVGTPLFMAPEQLAGGPASIKSDLYALGLILFEIFTGKRAHDAKTIADLKALHETGTVTTPSSIVHDLDPAIERVILRCLDRDPARRPGSALAVAAALPGGDPLAAALAAGETPSPEVLAAAAESEAMPVARGLALVATLVVSIAVYAVYAPRVTMAGLVPLNRATAVLADRAEQIRASFGDASAPADTAEGFDVAGDAAQWLVDTDATVARWSPDRVSKVPVLRYWLRTSPRDLDAFRPLPEIRTTDPPMTTVGMTLAVLDTRGRLQEFHRVPPQHDTAAAAPHPPDWDVVFQAAGLARAAFAEVPAEWTPRDYADERAAWEGPSPDDPSIRLRLEAASYRGDIVSASVVGPWTAATRMTATPQPALNRALGIFALVFSITAIVGAAALARYNVKAGRADRRSAARLAIASLMIEIAAWLISGHHTSSVTTELQDVFGIAAVSVFHASMLWVLYLALEPFGRRLWPDGLLGWTRLFSGHVRDARIGREVLIGVALGGVLMLIDLSRATAPYAIGRPPGVPSLGADVRTLVGPSQLAVSWMLQLYNSVNSAMTITMIFVVLRLLVRRTWLAVAVGLVVVTMLSGQNMPPGGVLWLDAAAQVAAIGLITIAIFRYGLLVTTVTLVVDNIPTAVPVTAHAASWAAVPGNLSIALVIALACFGYYASRGEQPLFV